MFSSIFDSREMAPGDGVLARLPIVFVWLIVLYQFKLESASKRPRHGEA
jgi:hypothetical protein